MQRPIQARIIHKLIDMFVSYNWCGFTTATDQQRIEGFLRRGLCAGYRHANDPTATQLAEDSDD